MNARVGAAGRPAAKVVLLLAVVSALSACGRSSVDGIATAQPLAFSAVDARVQAYMDCAIPAGRAKRLVASDYAEAAIRDAGFDALHRNAMEVASTRVPRYEETFAPHGDESGRAQGDLEAIVSAADDAKVPEGLRAKARAYEAYYQSLAVGSDCKLDEDVLKLINKG